MPVALRRTRIARTRNLRTRRDAIHRVSVGPRGHPAAPGGRLTLYHLQRKLLLCHVTVPPLRYRLFLL